MEIPGAGWVDNPFLFRTLCEAERICWVNEPLYYYRDSRPGSSTDMRDCSIPIDRVNDIENMVKQFTIGALSKRTFIEQSPYVSDLSQEISRLEAEGNSIYSDSAEEAEEPQAEEPQAENNE